MSTKEQCWRQGVLSANTRWEVEMADGDSGGTGVLGVIVGALIAVVIGGAVLYSTGTIGHNSSTVKIDLPKITTK
jgi:hypothetical protein